GRDRLVVTAFGATAAVGCFSGRELLVFALAALVPFFPLKFAQEFIAAVGVGIGGAEFVEIDFSGKGTIARYFTQVGDEFPLVVLELFLIVLQQLVHMRNFLGLLFQQSIGLFKLDVALSDFAFELPV